MNELRVRWYSSKVRKVQRLRVAHDSIIGVDFYMLTRWREYIRKRTKEPPAIFVPMCWSLLTQVPGLNLTKQRLLFVRLWRSLDWSRRRRASSRPPRA